MQLPVQAMGAALDNLETLGRPSQILLLVDRFIFQCTLYPVRPYLPASRF